MSGTKIKLVLLAALLSGCAMYQTESVTHVRRTPVEETPEKPEQPVQRPWYSPIAEGLGKLIAVEPLVGMFQVVGTTLVDMTGNITGAVVRVKRGSIYEQVTYKRSAWLSTKPFKFLQNPGELGIFTLPADEEVQDVASDDAAGVVDGD